MTQDPPASPPEQPDEVAPEPAAQDQVAQDQVAQDQVAQDQVAQDQPAQDQPAQPGQTVGEAGEPAQASGVPPPGGAAPPRRRLALLVTVGALAAVAILVVGAVVIVGIVSGGGPEAGDCMNDSVQANDMEVVDCDSDEAAWSVIGVETGRTFGDFEATSLEELCQAHPGSEQALWVTGASDVTDGTDGDVVCLAPLDPAPAGG